MMVMVAGRRLVMTASCIVKLQITGRYDTDLERVDFYVVQMWQSLYVLYAESAASNTRVTSV